MFTVSDNLTTVFGDYTTILKTKLSVYGHSENKAVYLFLASSNSSSVVAAYTQLKTQLGDDVYMLFDDTSSIWTHTHAHRLIDKPWPIDARELLFNEADCQSVYPEGTYVEYWQEPALYLFMHGLENPSFDYLWTFESDVRCHGDFVACVAPAAELDYDLLCANNPKFYQEDPSWYHWNRLGGPIASFPMEDRLECFMPVRRFSRHGLETLFGAKGTSFGYCEVFIPLLFTKSNLTVGKIPDESLGRVEYYVGDGPSEAEKAMWGTPHADNRFYHPIKRQK